MVKKNRFLLKIIIGVTIILSICLGGIYASISDKGELTGDGKINYDDVEKLELYLVQLTELTEQELKNADLSGDGEVTVTDLTLLIKKIENKLDYEVELKNLQANNYYPNKNEEITLSFYPEVSYGGTIKTIIINGNDYEITRSEINQDLYEIKVNVGNESGVKKYKFEKANLTNGQEIKLDNTLEVDVLKEVPHITCILLDVNK